MYALRVLIKDVEVCHWAKVPRGHGMIPSSEGFRLPLADGWVNTLFRRILKHICEGVPFEHNCLYVTVMQPSRA